MTDVLSFLDSWKGEANNFEIEQTNNLGTPYDFNSVMQYGKWVFSENIFNELAIIVFGRPFLFLFTKAEINFNCNVSLTAIFFSFILHLEESIRPELFSLKSCLCNCRWLFLQNWSKLKCISLFWKVFLFHKQPPNHRCQGWPLS